LKSVIWHFQSDIRASAPAGGGGVMTINKAFTGAMQAISFEAPVINNCITIEFWRNSDWPGVSHLGVLGRE
jgi:hypothetical protein